MGLKWKFQWGGGGGGVKPKNLPWEGYGYFMEQHIPLKLPPTFIVPLSTQVYKWVPANLLLGVSL